MPLTRRGRARALILLLGLVAAVGAGCVPAPPTAPAGARGPDLLFCFWNVENLFDDREDGRTQAGDREYDTWFARDPAARRLKYEHLAEAITRLNDGQGPDILAVAEVESHRAAELLQEACNARLPDVGLHYTHVLMKELHAGRHIAPAILTRLPVKGDRTRLHGRQQRILEGHVVVNGHDLVVIASHWTARLTDKTGDHRAKYGDEIYGLFRGMYRGNPAVDLLVCGDFNDPPDAPSVTRHLHATGDLEAVRAGGDPPVLFDLFAGKDPQEFGTHNYQRHWFIFDQIVVSPGMLDDTGWRCDPASARTVNTLVRPGDRQRRPWRFGGEHEKGARGYSDHFPVTVRLSVENAR